MISTSSRFSIPCLTTALAVISCPACFAVPVAESDFNTDSEGWLVAGDSASASPTYFATGGNPTGFVRGTDLAVGGVWTWDAPAKFLGDKSGSYGFPLTYDLRMRGNGSLFDDSDVTLNGGGLSLHFDQTASVPADVAWTSYSVVLSESAPWRVGSLSGPIATQADVQAVLTNLTRLQIRGEFITGPDNGDLDNVVLNGLPEPASGDFDNDGDIDGRDFLRWQRGGSPTPFSADDLADWQAEYNGGGPFTSALRLPPSALKVAVPEPGAVMLLSPAVASTFVLMRSCRKRKMVA